MTDDKTSLTRHPIDAARLVASLRRPDCGALAVFEGIVRADRSPVGADLLALDYSAYEEMALEQMRSLRTRALASFKIADAVIVHRLGRMALGETSVLIAVASAHRAQAFDACRWLIDTLKHDVPIWKQDIWSDGTSAWNDPIRSAAAEQRDSPKT